MARGRKAAQGLTPEEKLAQALVPVEDQPYVLPSNWIWLKHNSILDISGGSQPSKSLFISEPAEGYVQLYQTRDYGEHPVPVYIPNQYATKTAQDGDILLARYGGSLGKVFRAHEGAYNVALAKVIKIFPDIIDDDYLYQYYLSDFYQDFCIKAGSGRSAQAGFNRDDMEKIPFPLPPLSEQRRIVDRIESIFAKLDEAKEKAQAVVDGFELRNSAILHKAFTGELTAKWREEHSLTLDDWETDNLGDRFEIMSGVQKTPARTPKDHPIPYLAVANVYRDSVDVSEIRYFEVADDELERLKLKNKDLLIVEGNGSGNEIGRCAMWRGELPVCIHQNHIIRMRKKDEKILEEYVLYYLNSDAGKKIMKIRAKTTAGLYNLSVGKIRTIPVPFAMIEEQIEIVRILDSLLAKENAAKEAAESVLDHIDTMKKAVLARAFRGELGTNDPTEESAIELLKSML